MGPTAVSGAGWDSALCRGGLSRFPAQGVSTLAGVNRCSPGHTCVLRNVLLILLDSSFLLGCWFMLSGDCGELCADWLPGPSPRAALLALCQVLCALPQRAGLGHLLSLWPWLCSAWDAFPSEPGKRKPDSTCPASLGLLVTAVAGCFLLC